MPFAQGGGVPNLRLFLARGSPASAGLGEACGPIDLSSEQRKGSGKELSSLHSTPESHGETTVASTEGPIRAYKRPTLLGVHVTEQGGEGAQDTAKLQGTEHTRPAESPCGATLRQSFEYR